MSTKAIKHNLRPSSEWEKSAGFKGFQISTLRLTAHAESSARCDFARHAEMRAYMNEEPVQPVRPKWLAICKLQQAAAGVIAKMLQVGMHGVHATPEVNGMGIPETILLRVVLGNLQSKSNEIALRLLPALSALCWQPDLVAFPSQDASTKFHSDAAFVGKGSRPRHWV